MWVSQDFSDAYWLQSAPVLVPTNNKSALVRHAFKEMASSSTTLPTHGDTALSRRSRHLRQRRATENPRRC